MDMSAEIDGACCEMQFGELFAAFGDPLASLIGRKWGRVRILKGSLLGSFVCLAVCFGLGMLFFDWRFALIGALAATLAEMIPTVLDDNLIMVLFSGEALVLAGLYFNQAWF